MSNLRKNVLKNGNVLLAEANFRNADRANAEVIRKHRETRRVRKETLKAQRSERAKAETAYNKAVQEALVKAKEYFGDKKFTAIELEGFLNKDVSWQEFSSWVAHNNCGKFHTSLSSINYHLPEGAKTTGPYKTVKRYAQLDENGQIIPGTEICREYKECALYWFE